VVRSFVFEVDYVTASSDAAAFKALVAVEGQDALPTGASVEHIELEEGSTIAHIYFTSNTNLATLDADLVCLRLLLRAGWCLLLTCCFQATFDDVVLELDIVYNSVPVTGVSLLASVTAVPLPRIAGPPAPPHPNSAASREGAAMFLVGVACVVCMAW
jgi:hypothetical protein